MKLNPNIAARERNHATQPGRAGSPSAYAARQSAASARRRLPAAEGDKMFALPANSRRRAPVLRSGTAEGGRSVAPHPRLNSLRSLRSFAAIVVSLLFAGTAAHAQVNSGSDGHDGAFNPTTNTVVDMADHPDGIYQYTSINIPTSVTVTFIPNAANTPAVWLVQSNCVINGIINLNGQSGQYGGASGPGGYRGGNTGGGGAAPSDGAGPGGGGSSDQRSYGGSASFATLGEVVVYSQGQAPAGSIYGNPFCLPLIGGSGGGGAGRQGYTGKGGGGAGAILIAASDTIQLSGTISASGGGNPDTYCGGSGSGGAVRLASISTEENRPNIFSILVSGFRG